MQLTHTFTVPTSVDDAWALFMDLEKVGGCFPGATVTEVTGDGFSGTVKVKLGPIALLYSGSGSFVSRDDEAHRAVITAKGKDKRGNGTAGATVTIALTRDGSGTRADVVTDLAVTGKPAQFGRGVMQDVSDKLLMAFIACIEARLRESGRPEDSFDAAEIAGVRAPAGGQAGAGDAGSGDAGSGDAGSGDAGSHDGGDGDAGVVQASGAATTTGTAASATTETTAGATTDTTAWSDRTAWSGTAPTADVAAAPAPERAAYPVGRHGDTASSPHVGGDDALDLGSAVLPVLVRRYAGYVGAAAVGLVLGVLLGRRGRD